MRAVLRRGRGEVPRRPRSIAASIWSPTSSGVVAVDGSAVRLTRREFELLKYLVENRNRVLSRDRLLERVWGYDRVIETRSVDVHVGRLRSKLGAAGNQIETVVGPGLPIRRLALGESTTFRPRTSRREQQRKQTDFSVSLASAARTSRR